ncbi:hypothetical protein RA2_04562 [Roseovarius sp. A-2]|nr:hypothetical protein RA2_04562 [Roseovarius sp. A-2]
MTNTTLDREHDLLIDVPPELLNEALIQLNKEYML